MTKLTEFDIFTRCHTVIPPKPESNKGGEVPNRRWEGGNDPSIIPGYELDRPDSTATEYVRTGGSRKHNSHAFASSQLRDWLGHIPLDLLSYHTGIDRHTLRSVRDGHLARREVLAALKETKKLWINAERCGELKKAIDSIRQSRRDYKNGGELREIMIREKKPKEVEFRDDARLGPRG